MEETEMQRNTENEIEEIQEETLPGEEPKTPENREEETRKEAPQEEEKQEEEKQEEPISRKAEKKAARELPELRRRLAEAEEKADAAEKKNAELSDKYLRLAAEYDNFRRRTAAERQGAYTDGMGDTLEKILPLVDNLDRAALYEDADKVAKGVAMISRAAADALTALGVEEFGAVGDTFDPNLHNAVMHVEEEGRAEGEITAVHQKGYKKGDRILRYAMVTVAN